VGAPGSDAAQQASAVLGADIGCHFDHVAIAAPRLRDLVPLWVDALNGEFQGGGDDTRSGYRTARIAYSGGFAIELMEPLPGRSYEDPRWHEMFVHPKAGHGVLLQVVRHPPHIDGPHETLAQYLASIE
jgi:methylmalonyl-CoA/ethylmalonyl-CoA epimerase